MAAKPHDATAWNAASRPAPAARSAAEPRGPNHPRSDNGSERRPLAGIAAAGRETQTLIDVQNLDPATAAAIRRPR